MVRGKELNRTAEMVPVRSESAEMTGMEAGSMAYPSQTHSYEVWGVELEHSPKKSRNSLNIALSSLVASNSLQKGRFA